MITRCELTAQKAAVLTKFINSNYVGGFASRRAINATKADQCVEVKEIRYDFILPLLI